MASNWYMNKKWRNNKTCTIMYMVPDRIKACSKSWALWNWVIKSPGFDLSHAVIARSYKVFNSHIKPTSPGCYLRVECDVKQIIITSFWRALSLSCRFRTWVARPLLCSLWKFLRTEQSSQENFGTDSRKMNIGGRSHSIETNFCS